MNKQDFIAKYQLHDLETTTLSQFLAALDVLYLNFTYDEAIEVVKDYLDNADNIYNS